MSNTREELPDVYPTHGNNTNGRNGQKLYFPHEIEEEVKKGGSRIQLFMRLDVVLS